MTSPMNVIVARKEQLNQRSRDEKKCSRLNFCTMLEADLSSAKRESERERTAAELAKKSLEEARSELKILRESNKVDTSFLVFIMFSVDS